MNYWEQRYRREGRRTVGCNRFTEKQFQEKTAEILERFEPRFKILFRNKIVLDFGCGWGRFSKPLASFSWKVYGIDISTWAIQEAKKYAPECEFYKYEGDVIPFPDSFFEGVLCWTVLQHIPPDKIMAVCSEITRVCEKGAYLVLYENVTENLNNKSHIWFRDVDQYIKLFDKFIWHITEHIKRMDDIDEDHAFIVLEKKD